MPFQFGDPIWVRFYNEMQLKRDGEIIATYKSKDKVKAVILRDYDFADPSCLVIPVKLLIEDQSPFFCDLRSNQATINVRYTKDQLPQFEIFSNNRDCLTLREFWVKNLEYESELHNLPHVCSLKGSGSGKIVCEKAISDELFDVAGELLCKPWVKPWSQQGEGNVPFNPSMVFTYENDWAQMMCALQWLPATPIEVDGEAWDHFLGVLPPLMMSCYFEFEGTTHRLSYVMGEGTPLTGGFYKNNRHYLISVPSSALVWKDDKAKAITARKLYYTR